MAIAKIKFFSEFLLIIHSTGSYPPFEKGLHLNTRQNALALPLAIPCFFIASLAYVEQEGLNLQLFINKGLITFWYFEIIHKIAFFIFFLSFLRA